MTTTATTIQPGDVYCPRCRSTQIQVLHRQESWELECQSSSCGNRWDWAYDYERHDWVWQESRRPNPGCLWCGTCNIELLRVSGLPAVDGVSPGIWACGREACRRTWVGSFAVARFTADGPLRMSRWTIRVPTPLVPFTWLADDGAPLIRWGAGTLPR